MKTNRNRLLYSVLVLAVLYFLYDAQAWLVRIPAYRHLYRGHPFYVPEGIKASLEILLCMAAVALSLGKNFRQAFTELGLDRGFKKGLLFGFLSTSPFFLGLAITHHLGQIVWSDIFYLDFFAPFSQELVVRAYGFGQLYRRCRWPVWLAIIPTAVLFGWGHVEQGGNFREAAALFFILTAGGVFFAWFYYHWDSIWSLDCPCPDEFLLGAFFRQQDRAGRMVSVLPAVDHDSVRRLADVEGHKKTIRSPGFSLMPCLPTGRFFQKEDHFQLKALHSQ